MDLSYQEHMELSDAIKDAVGGRYDGSKKNILVPECPNCGKSGDKFGIYVGQRSGRKIPFSSNCFSCGWRSGSLYRLLDKIGRLDLMPTETTNLNKKIEIDEIFKIDVGDDDGADELVEVDMPKSYFRVFSNPYLKKRGFTFDDYNYFEVGVTSKGNARFKDYIIFPVIENDVAVGYVSRHKWSKSRIDRYNRDNFYKVFRYRNSSEEEGNDFQHLLYNIDAIKEFQTRTVILTEGIFDAIALTRKLNIYESNSIAVCATFGKQISETKMLKLQNRGVENIIIGYDGDAAKYTSEAANMLDDYFDVLVADIEDENKDWDDLEVDEIYDIFANKLLTPVEFNFKKLKI